MLSLEFCVELQVFARSTRTALSRGSSEHRCHEEGMAVHAEAPCSLVAVRSGEGPAAPACPAPCLSHMWRLVLSGFAVIFWALPHHSEKNLKEEPRVTRITMADYTENRGEAWHSLSNEEEV